MKSPGPEAIFSPKRKEGNVFNFSPRLQQQRRQRSTETEKAQGMEHKPMLCSSRNGSESDIEPDNLSDSNRGKFGIHISVVNCNQHFK
jgi:hypothetical protein